MARKSASATTVDRPADEADEGVEEQPTEPGPPTVKAALDAPGGCINQMVAGVPWSATSGSGGSSVKVYDYPIKPAAPGKQQATGATAGKPGSWTPAGSEAPDGKATAPQPTPTTAWKDGAYVALKDGTTNIYWDGSAWADGKAPASGPSKGAAKPSDTFPAETTVTASDAANAAKLAGLGYVANPTTAWTTGQKITVGTFDFSWDGSAWKAGAAT